MRRLVFSLAAALFAVAAAPVGETPSPFGVRWGESPDAAAARLPAGKAIETADLYGVLFDARNVSAKAHLGFAEALPPIDGRPSGIDGVIVTSSGYQNDPRAEDILTAVEALQQALTEKYGAPEEDVFIDPDYRGPDAALGLKIGRSRWRQKWSLPEVDVYFYISRAEAGGDLKWTLHYLHRALRRERDRREAAKAKSAL